MEIHSKQWCLRPSTAQLDDWDNDCQGTNISPGIPRGVKGWILVKQEEKLASQRKTSTFWQQRGPPCLAERDLHSMDRLAEQTWTQTIMGQWRAGPPWRTACPQFKLKPQYEYSNNGFGGGVSGPSGPLPNLGTLDKSLFSTVLYCLSFFIGILRMVDWVGMARAQALL